MKSNPHEALFLTKVKLALHLENQASRLDSACAIRIKPDQTMITRLLLFLLLNFGALALGGFFTGKGVPSEWYAGLAKAPWTPPGWVFGAAWTTIMLCFSIYMARIWTLVQNKRFLLVLFAAQWILNVSWNPIFFHFHFVLAALLVIGALTLLVGYILFTYRKILKIESLLIAPYLVWLLIATSLNLYIYLYN